MPVWLQTGGLLIASNVFMTFAWYGHLKFTSYPLYIAVIASWGIAFFEYWLAVPANRIGHQVYSAAELKTMQEVITLAVFAVFSVLFLKESLTEPSHRLRADRGWSDLHLPGLNCGPPLGRWQAML